MFGSRQTKHVSQTLESGWSMLGMGNLGSGLGEGQGASIIAPWMQW